MLRGKTLSHCFKSNVVAGKKNHQINEGERFISLRDKEPEFFCGYSDWAASLMAEELGFSSWQVEAILLFAEAPRPTLAYRTHFPRG
jgi:hypothetical protein